MQLVAYKVDIRKRLRVSRSKELGLPLDLATDQPYLHFGLIGHYGLILFPSATAQDRLVKGWRVDGIHLGRGMADGRSKLRPLD